MMKRFWKTILIIITILAVAASVSIIGVSALLIKYKNVKRRWI